MFVGADLDDGDEKAGKVFISKAKAAYYDDLEWDRDNKKFYKNDLNLENTRARKAFLGYAFTPAGRSCLFDETD